MLFCKLLGWNDHFDADQLVPLAFKSINNLCNLMTLPVESRVELKENTMHIKLMENAF
jgi:hypothetical protein